MSFFASESGIIALARAMQVLAAWKEGGEERRRRKDRLKPRQLKDLPLLHTEIGRDRADSEKRCRSTTCLSRK